MSHESDPINGPRLPQETAFEGSAHAMQLSKLQAERERLLDTAINRSPKELVETKILLGKLDSQIRVLKRLLGIETYEEQCEGVAKALRISSVLSVQISNQVQMAQDIANFIPKELTKETKSVYRQKLRK